MQSDRHERPFRRLPVFLSCARWILRKIRIITLRVENIKAEVAIHPSFVIGAKASVVVPKYFKVDRDVAIGGHLYSQTNVDIGPECLISSKVSFIGNDHYLIDGKSKYFSGRAQASTVVLEGDNFIGFGATICGNVRIGHGSIVGSCALVLKDVPSNCVVAGVPAKIIKRL